MTDWTKQKYVCRSGARMTVVVYIHDVLLKTWQNKEKNIILESKTEPMKPMPP